MLDALKFFLFVLVLLVTIILNRNVQSNRSGERNLALLWQIQDSDGVYVVPNQTLPSGVYTALEQSMVIGSLLEEYNDVNTSWVATMDWVYWTELACSGTEDYRYVMLTFHGVDTFADVYLGQQLLGTTENMFVRYRFDVKKQCTESSQQLRVRLRSPVNEAALRASDRKLAIPPECPPEPYNGRCHVNMIRKMQASFAWDWGLAAPSMGLWKPVTVEYYGSALVRDLTVGIEEMDTVWLVTVGVYLETGLESQPVRGTLTFRLLGVMWKDGGDAEVVTVSDRSNSTGEFMVEHQLTVAKSLVSRWWPSGYGKQQLYHLYVKWEDEEANSVDTYRRYIVSSDKVVRIGFRTVTLCQERTDDGLMFYFKVNDVPMFMKGSNWIPSSVLPERSYDTNYVKFLLYAAKEANMNMLRVWGGGVYESDYFYQLADELGILLWHDLMFACSMYPTDRPFLDTVRLEVRQNIRRIQHHASVAVWATNNENEAALRQNWYGTAGNYTAFYMMYVELYVNNVLPEIQAIDRWHPVLISSPSNGDQSVKDRYVAQNPQDPLYGDVHFYDYLLNGWNAAIYRGGRFVSEYGFQSFPAFGSWPEARILPRDAFAELVRHRQHHPLGNAPILRMIEANLPLPANNSDTYWPQLIYLSQLSQAMIVKTETEVYRSKRLEHGTMGALYWQLNDVWIAPSWSSIEYGGKFKILHGWLRDIFAPEHIVGYVDARNNLALYAIRDTLGADEQWDVRVQIYPYASLTPLPGDFRYPAVTVPPNTVVRIDTVDVYGYLDKQGLNRHEHMLVLTAHRNGTKLAENFVLLDKLKRAQTVRDPHVAVAVTFVQCNAVNNVTRVSLEVTVSAPALFVYLQLTPENGTLEQCQFSKNGFHHLTAIQTVYLQCVSIGGCKNGSGIHSRDIEVLTVNQLLLA